MDREQSTGSAKDFVLVVKSIIGSGKRDIAAHIVAQNAGYQGTRLKSQKWLRFKLCRMTEASKTGWMMKKIDSEKALSQKKLIGRKGKEIKSAGGYYGGCFIF